LIIDGRSSTRSGHTGSPEAAARGRANRLAMNGGVQAQPVGFPVEELDAGVALILV